MKNMIRGKKLIFMLALFVVILSMVFVCCNLTIHNLYAETIDNEIVYLTENKYAITNEKTPNGLDFENYSKDHYGKNAILSWETEKTMEVKGDDDIVKIIPEELFKKEGIVQHFGRHYGFFIETKKAFADNDMLLSTVMIINMVNDNKMAGSATTHLKFKVQPIFQADFAYIKRGNNTIYSLDEQTRDFFENKYKKDLHIVYPAIGDGFVVPLPTWYFEDGAFGLPKLAFKQHNKYYLTEISNQVSLYNANDYNPYDEKYIPENDMGCFFTQIDCNYNGFFLEQGTANIAEKGEVAYNAAMLAFDIYDKAKGLKSVFKAIPVLGDVVTTIDIINGINQIVDNGKMQEITSSENISYTPLLNSKELQLNEYKCLAKDTAVAIKSNDVKKLLYGSKHTNGHNEFF